MKVSRDTVGRESLEEKRLDSNIRIGFIGFGNMAQAMVKGLILKAVLPPKQIYACAKNWEKLCGNAKKMGIQPCRSVKELVEHADVIVAAVKPYLIQEVLEPVKNDLKDKILVSVAAGWLFERYEEILAPGTHHISTLPNTPVSVGEGIIICEEKHSLTEEGYALFERLFRPVGMIQPVDTKHFGIAGTIGGCGPAFAAMFIEALADAAVLHGLPRELSYGLASQMVAGTGKLQRATKEHPGAMKDAVCSPGGTTIVGVAALERNGLRSAVIDAVDRIMKK